MPARKHQEEAEIIKSSRMTSLISAASWNYGDYVVGNDQVENFFSGKLSDIIGRSLTSARMFFFCYFCSGIKNEVVNFQSTHP